MGRIAEALKKAEAERRARLVDAQQSSSVAVLGMPPDEGAAPPGDGEFAVQPVVSDPEVRDMGVHESIAPFYDRSSIISEQYRSLRTRLLTQNPQNDHRVIAVTSAIPREGKSVTTANLGVVMSEIRHFKVMVVDGDFRRGRLSRLLDLQPGPGLADLLRGEAAYEEVVQKTAIPNLYCVAAGETSGRSAAELLSSHRSSAVIRRFQTEFHYTLFDTPPATTVTDAGIVGQMCNGVIMIVRLKFTPEPIARRAVRLLKVNKIPILGLLLIGQDERSVGYNFSYGYYRYYRSYYYGGGSQKAAS